MWCQKNKKQIKDSIPTTLDDNERLSDSHRARSKTLLLKVLYILVKSITTKDEIQTAEQ